MLFFLDIFLKLYMYNSVLLLFTVDKPDVKLCWWQPLGASKGHIYISPSFPRYLRLANCKSLLQVATYYLPLASSDLLLATTELPLATCDLRLATCHLSLATCGLPIATCELLHTFFFFEEFVCRILKGSPLTNTLSKMCLYMSLKCVLLSILLRATERKLETLWHVNSTCCIRASFPFGVFVKISYAKGWFSPVMESWLLNCCVVVELTKEKN